MVEYSRTRVEAQGIPSCDALHWHYLIRGVSARCGKVRHARRGHCVQ